MTLIDKPPASSKAQAEAEGGSASQKTGGEEKPKGATKKEKGEGKDGEAGDEDKEQKEAAAPAEPVPWPLAEIVERVGIMSLALRKVLEYHPGIGACRGSF